MRKPPRVRMLSFTFWTRGEAMIFLAWSQLS